MVSGLLDDDLMLRVDTDMEACVDMVDLIKVVQDEFMLKNPRMIARYKWFKIRMKTDESYSDFLAREKTQRKPADVHEMTTEDLIAHVHIQACNNDDLLKKTLGN